MGSSDNDEHTAKRQCLSSVKSEVYHHHPLFTEVNTTAEKEELVTLHVLNDDTLDMILSYLHVVELFRMILVCRRWYNLCLQKISRISCFSVSCLAFRTREFDKAAHIDNVVSALSLNCGSLTTLSLYRVVGMKADHLSYLSDNLPNLINLRLDADFLRDETIVAVIQDKLAPRLVSLCIILNGSDYKLHKTAVNSVLINTKQLAHFSLDDQWPLLNKTQGTPLDKLSLALVNSLTSVEITNIKELKTSVVQFIMRNFASTLEYLNLSGTYMIGHNIVTMEYSLPELRNMKVFISYTNWMDYGFLISILKLMPNVKVLDLSGNHHFSENDFDIVDILSRHCLLLEELHLSNCWIPAEKLENLQKLKCLKRLCLDGLPEDWGSFNDQMCPEPRLVEILSEHDPAVSLQYVASNVLPYLEALEYLSMCNVSFDKDDLALFIGSTGPNFKTLVLSASTPKDIKRFYTVYEDNPFEEALKECNSVVRKEPFNLIIMLGDYEYLNKKSCYKDSLALYNVISPNYLQVVGSDVCEYLRKDFVSVNHRLSRSYGKTIEFPCF